MFDIIIHVFVGFPPRTSSRILSFKRLFIFIYLSFKQIIGYFLLSIHNIILLFIVRIENKHTDFVNLISNPFCSTHCYIVVVAFDVKKCVYLADLFTLCYRKMLGLQ